MNERLYRASERGEDGKLRKLLDKRRKKSDIDKPNRQEGGWTPLHAAACNGQAGCVKMLLGEGATVEPAPRWRLLISPPAPARSASGSRKLSGT